MANEPREEIPDPTLKKCTESYCKELGTVVVSIQGKDGSTHCADCANKWASLADHMGWQFSANPVPGHGAGLQLFWLTEAAKEG